MKIKPIGQIDKKIESTLLNLLIKDYCLYIKKTCPVCPTQWEGYTNDNKWFYFRYRWGNLQFEIWEKEEFEGKKIYERYIKEFDPEPSGGYLNNIVCSGLIMTFLEDYYCLKKEGLLK